MTQKLKKSALIFALMIVCFTGLFETLYQLTPLPAFEREAGTYLADVRERAAYAYAAARTLNATISLLESVDAGVGLVSFQPGQVLEPINDMIEQFSDLVLLALASVGVQEILIAVLGDLSWTYLLPLALLPSLVAPWAGSQEKRLTHIARIFLMSVIATRLLIPSIALGGHMISEQYLKPDYMRAIEQVETVREKTNEAIGANKGVSQAIPPLISNPNEKSVFSQSGDDSNNTVLVPNWDTVKGMADSERILTLLNNIPERIITLITIFTFETIVMPILMGFLFLWLARVVLRHYP